MHNYWLIRVVLKTFVRPLFFKRLCRHLQITLVGTRFHHLWWAAAWPMTVHSWLCHSPLVVRMRSHPSTRDGQYMIKLRGEHSVGIPNEQLHRGCHPVSFIRTGEEQFGPRSRALSSLD